MNKTSVYEYADGNGNTYKLQPSSLEYLPVKKEESSSGMYSGGEPRKVTITTDQYENISKLLESAFENTSIHINNRMMMSGVVRVVAPDSTRSCIIKPGSAELLSIEQALKSIIGNK